MALTYNGVTPTKIIYNGTELTKLTYNGVLVWSAAGKELAITFPGGTVSTQVTILGVSEYLHTANSATTTYEGYGSYTTCAIGGVTVGTDWTYITSSKLGNATTTRYAKFSGGVLSVRSNYSETSTSSASKKVRILIYSATAVFSTADGANVASRQLASSTCTFDNVDGERITLSGYPNEINFELRSGSQTCAFYYWKGWCQQTGFNTIFDYDDLYDYDYSVLKVYYADYNSLTAGAYEGQFSNAGIKPIFTLRLKDGYWEQLE